MFFQLILVLATLSASDVVGFEYTTESYVLATTESMERAAVNNATDSSPESDRAWEDLVLAAPSTVNYLGLFMVLSSRRDYSLLYPPGLTFKYISNNGSLRYSLNTLSSSMLSAFQYTLDDLQRVRISMEQIPDHIQASLVVIQSAPIDLLNRLLPYTIRNIERAIREGSVVSKPALQRFVDMKIFIDELARLVREIKPTADNGDFLVEANGYCVDLQSQWYLLISLLGNISNRTDLMQTDIAQDFVDIIREAHNQNAFQSAATRNIYLQRLIAMTASLDKYSEYLNMVMKTFSEIVETSVINQLRSNTLYTTTMTDALRVSIERQLWKDIINQSIRVARLTQARHNDFIARVSNRHIEYSLYSNSTLTI